MLAGAPALGALKALADGSAQTKFPFGIASGDPLKDRVILWTKIHSMTPVDVEWQVAADEDFSTLISSGKKTSSASNDHIIKVDAMGLAPGQRYFYRFKVGESVSPVGRTRTLPENDVSQIRFAVTSCANYPYGFFNVYRHMAERDDLDAVLHLGDYIYEYPRGFYASEAIEALGRVVNPAGEIIALDDYRARYATYRLDPDLQAVHQAHPFIAVWDDHEAANDSYATGAENHNEGEGDWMERRAAARQAYFEWMPIRENSGDRQGEIYRSFDFGNLARLIMLDTRLSGRVKPLTYGADIEPEQITHDNEAKPRPDIKSFIEKKLLAPDRTILGKTQEDWLRNELMASKAKGQPWQILGQQVLVGNLPIPKGGERLLPKEDFPQRKRVEMMFDLAPFKLPINLDAWDGYPAAKQRLIQDIMAHANNTVILAGDSHNAWAFDIKAGDIVAAAEFGTASVTSPGLETYIPIKPSKLRRALVKASPELNWTNSTERGYITLTVTEEKTRADFYFVETVAERHAGATLEKSFEVQATTTPGVAPMKKV
jgi:alkaline phosphatase D